MPDEVACGSRSRKSRRQCASVELAHWSGDRQRCPPSRVRAPRSARIGDRCGDEQLHRRADGDRRAGADGSDSAGCRRYSHVGGGPALSHASIGHLSGGGHTRRIRRGRHSDGAHRGQCGIAGRSGRPGEAPETRPVRRARHVGNRRTGTRSPRGAVAADPRPATAAVSRDAPQHHRRHLPTVRARIRPAGHRRCHSQQQHSGTRQLVVVGRRIHRIRHRHRNSVRVADPHRHPRPHRSRSSRASTTRSRHCPSP